VRCVDFGMSQELMNVVVGVLGLTLLLAFVHSASIGAPSDVAQAARDPQCNSTYDHLCIQVENRRFLVGGNNAT
jgi:hypothetical protein